MLLKSNNRFRIFLILLLLIIVNSYISNSYALDYEGIQIHGFLSQSYLKTYGNNYLNDSESGTFDFTQAGINFHYRPTERLSLFSQFLSRNFGDTYSNEKDISVDLLFANYAAYSTQNYKLDLKFGRVKNRYGLMNTIRDIPFAHLGVLPDQALYNEYDRFLLLYGDGLILENKFINDWGTVDLIAQYSSLSEDEKETFATYPELAPYVKDFSGVSVKSLQWIYTNPRGDWQFSYTFNKIRAGTAKFEGLPPDAQIPLQYDLVWRVNAYNHILSTRYQGKRFTITTEYMARKIVNDYLATIQSMGTDIKSREILDSDIFYVQGAYKIGYDFELFASYNYAMEEIEGQRDYTSPYDSFRKQFTIGFDWNVYENTLFKAEFHRINGTYDMLKEPDSNTEVDRYWNMFILQLSYQF